VRGRINAMLDVDTDSDGVLASSSAGEAALVADRVFMLETPIPQDFYLFSSEIFCVGKEVEMEGAMAMCDAFTGNSSLICM
jgi:hypothetical protein